MHYVVSFQDLPSLLGMASQSPELKWGWAVRTAANRVFIYVGNGFVSSGERTRGEAAKRKGGLLG